MLERKSYSEKHRKYPELQKKRIAYQFSRLFQYSEIILPVDLQNFISNEKRFFDGDFPRTGTNKIRVILKINESKDTPSCLTINKNQNCIGLIDPTPSRRTQTSISAINLFPFDSIFTENDKKESLLSNSLVDPILNFFRGKDACVFSFGNSGLGKTKTMIGSDQTYSGIGIIPCALAWIFSTLDQLRSNQKIEYIVRISAMEIANKNLAHDLLPHSTAVPHISDPGPVSLEKPFTTQREVTVVCLQEAGQILDRVLIARSNDDESLTHLHVIIHLYQYRIDKNKCAEIVTMPLLTGRSRLHFLDLGSGRHGNDDSSILSLQGMSKVILALYTSQRHIPYKENILTQLLKETLGVNTMTTMIVHISNKEQNYNETLQIVQLASKLYRTRSRKSRSVGFLMSDETSSYSSSSSGFHSRRPRPHMGIGAARRSSGNSSASSELDVTSASELSCCETVIFCGKVDKYDQENSGMQRSIKTRSTPLESDFVISDKESSKDHVSNSPRLLSPSVCRRRRISPRTNARAWPSTNVGSNSVVDSGPELWVDGPNAVYKSNSPDIPEGMIAKTKNTEQLPANVTKPLMISKETQCDDIWDSSSSITDGSSHSNTLDRKENRPLSDISECTEETESNVANDMELSKINEMDDISPLSELDDLLESTFGLGHLQEQGPQTPSGNDHNYSEYLPNKATLDQSVNEDDTNAKTTLAESCDCCSNDRTVILGLDKAGHSIKSMSKPRKHYHSASDSKKSTKSDQRERKCKSKCKRCFKKRNDALPSSITLSNSTDFSRVKSWIQSVEHEILDTDNKPDSFSDRVHDKNVVFNHSLHCHHQSQPDISGHKDRFTTHITSANQYPLHDCSQAYHVSSYINEKGPSPDLYVPGNSKRVSDHEFQPSIVYTHYDSTMDIKNLGYTHNQLNMPNTRPLLPPLPHLVHHQDVRLSLGNSSQKLLSLDGQKTNPTSTQVHHVTKCITLPRDIYSDSVTQLKWPVNDNVVPKIRQYKGQCLPAMPDIMSRSRSKKDSKNIMSIFMAPFISLRNKINKTKSTLPSHKNHSDTDTERSMNRELKRSPVSDWPIIDLNSSAEFILPSPYHLVTSPKTEPLATESSGHGSDSSSLNNRMTVKTRSLETAKPHNCRIKSAGHNYKSNARQRPTSSGYGSIIIKGDSEVSSHNDSSSEYSISGPKIINSHSKMKHSISLSNCKTVIDKFVNSTVSNSNEGSEMADVMTAHNFILREKLKNLLNQERLAVIEYIETSRLRGLPVDAFIMNLNCFKGIENIEISNSMRYDECQSIIKEIDQEMEQLKLKLSQAQNHLLLITSFDSKSQ